MPVFTFDQIPDSAKEKIPKVHKNPCKVCRMLMKRQNKYPKGERNDKIIVFIDSCIICEDNDRIKT